MASSSLSLHSPPLKPFNRLSSPSTHATVSHFLPCQHAISAVCTSIAAFPTSRAWDPVMVEETRKKIEEKYGNDFSEYIKEPSDAIRAQLGLQPESAQTENLYLEAQPTLSCSDPTNRIWLEGRRQKKGRSQKRKPDEMIEEGDNTTKSPKTKEEQLPRTTHKLLQVLGGKVRRKKLLSPAGMDVRPMMQIVRGAAFGILQSAGGRPASLRPGRWLDLYSGTGSVGIEAMSRGCSEAHFVEMDPWVISEVLKPNLRATDFIDVSVIHAKRVESFLEYAEKFPDKDNKFDYISVTPPYLEVDYAKLMDQISRSPLVGEDCFVLVEYPLKTTMPETCGHLIKIVDRRFGRTNLLIYGPQWAEKKKRKE